MNTAEIMTNRLASCRSLYLRQHADDPVSWQPWDDQALGLARGHDRPIFLSVGYATCHWCHVMAHESFADPAVAAVLAAGFVSIKVDREERPDLDQVYMRYLQASTGGGGWPMSLFLTPALAPICGGTYWPQAHLLAIIKRVAEAWREDRAGLDKGAEAMIEALRRECLPPLVARAVIGSHTLADQAHEICDRRYGGFGAGPKFPRPALLMALLAGDQPARAMALDQLRAMAAGGIHDQLGGGFHRYAVDQAWRIPHFEKMLYDQGQLLACYADAWRGSGEEVYRAALRAIVVHLERDMLTADGAFAAALDADGQRADGTQGEGAVYVWRQADVLAVLGDDDGAVALDRYGLEPAGNAPSDADPHGQLRGWNSLWQARSIAALAAEHGVEDHDMTARLEGIRDRLLAWRLQLPQPGRDDKIIAAWNALAVRGLVRAGRVSQEPGWINLAARVMATIRDLLWDPATGRLWRLYCDGRSAVPAMALDLATCTAAALDLFEAGAGGHWLLWAMALDDSLQRHHAEGGGGWLDDDGSDPSVRLRTMDCEDGAEPAATPLAADNCRRLAGLLNDPGHRSRLDAALARLGPAIASRPFAVPGACRLVGLLRRPARRIVIAGQGPQRDALLEATWQAAQEADVIIPVDATARALLAPTQSQIAALDQQRPVALICSAGHCHPPIDDPQVLIQALDSRGMMGLPW